MLSIRLLHRRLRKNALLFTGSGKHYRKFFGVAVPDKVKSKTQMNTCEARNPQKTAHCRFSPLFSGFLRQGRSSIPHPCLS
jgi:hypothetical protein